MGDISVPLSSACQSSTGVPGQPSASGIVSARSVPTINKKSNLKCENPKFRILGKFTLAHTTPFPRGLPNYPCQLFAWERLVPQPGHSLSPPCPQSLQFLLSTYLRDAPDTSSLLFFLTTLDTHYHQQLDHFHSFLPFEKGRKYCGGSTHLNYRKNHQKKNLLCGGIVVFWAGSCGWSKGNLYRHLHRQSPSTNRVVTSK
jgi:hypothetical protein